MMIEDGYGGDFRGCAMRVKRKRIVIKVGTNVLTLESGELNLGVMQNIATQIKALKKKGYDVILVSSGAIGCGMQILGIDEYPTDLGLKQTCAAAGQTKLMQTWQLVFGDVYISQNLITRAAFSNEKNIIDFKRTLKVSLNRGIIPIVNENDAVSTAEIDEKFTDNDELTASVAALICADMVFVLTDVHGLYDDNPQINPNANLIRRIEDISRVILDYANGAGKNGRGGMKSKLLSILRIVECGIDAYLLHGKIYNGVLSSIDGNSSGTYFPGVKRK
ncbi:glutamate 5-kinase [Patescibacteria group bacterium]